jgi:hypothetical protein
MFYESITLCWLSSQKNRLVFEISSHIKNNSTKTNPRVDKLAQRILPASQYEEAQTISLMIYRKERLRAIHRLKEIAKPPPRRPLWYLQAELMRLPRWTRTCMDFLGAYIEILAAGMTFELTEDRSCLCHPLGSNIYALSHQHNVSSDLVECLKEFNSVIYRPAKHLFNTPVAQEHLFTSKDVVLTVFIAKNLAHKITSLSKLATDLSLGKAEIAIDHITYNYDCDN